MKGHCIKSLKTLLSCGIEDLHDDGFEGSVNENHIFKEVFFGHKNSRSNERCLVTQSINFKNDQNMHKNILFRSDSDDSVMTSDSGQISVSGDFPLLLTRYSPDVEVKRRKISPEEHSESQSYLEKIVKSPIPLKEVDSDENNANKVLVTTSEPVQGSKHRWKDSSFIELEKDELLIPPKDSTADPKPLLRFYAYRLLKAAGWLVGRRNRSTKGLGEYIFKTPEGRPIREFHRAWSMCGQRLLQDSQYIGVCDNDLKWTELTQFRSDLSNTLREVENTASALSHRWYLLDPFAKVVFIDKSLAYLKEGKEVKVARTVVNISKSRGKVRGKRKVKEKSYKKANKKQKDKKGKGKCYLKDGNLLLSAILTKRSTTTTTTKRKYNTKKGSFRLLPRSFPKGRQNHHHVKGKWSGLGVRSVLSWLIDYGVIRLSEVIQYRNPQNDSVVKDGLVTRSGILCRCCNQVFCVSEFKNHAGFISVKHACLDLFMESGKALTVYQLEAWSTEYKVRKSATRVVQVEGIDESDDSCGLCGDGGELICCDNCPSTFHQSCLSTQDLPEGNWYCSTCCCWICGNVVNHNEGSISTPLKCLQCQHKYHEECIKEYGIGREWVGPTWFCGETCEKIHSGLNSHIGCINPISDGFSWSILKCIHGDQKFHSDENFVALKAECNLKLAVALTIMEECFLPMVDTRTGIHIIPHVVYNWGSEFVRLNYEGFYTVVLEKDDILLCVASLRIHGATVAEMPLIATCSKYRRQGMCRRLMNAIEEMLKWFKVEKLVVSAIPSLVETWIEGFGFSPLEADEKKCLDKTNLMVFPGTVWLKKPMYNNNHSIIGGAATEAVASDLNCDVEDKFLQQVGDEDHNLVEQDIKLSCEQPTLKMDEIQLNWFVM